MSNANIPGDIQKEIDNAADNDADNNPKIVNSVEHCIHQTAFSAGAQFGYELALQNKLTGHAGEPLDAEELKAHALMRHQLSPDIVDKDTRGQLIQTIFHWHSEWQDAVERRPTASGREFWIGTKIEAEDPWPRTELFDTKQEAEEFWTHKKPSDKYEFICVREVTPKDLERERKAELREAAVEKLVAAFRSMILESKCRTFNGTDLGASIKRIQSAEKVLAEWEALNA